MSSNENLHGADTDDAAAKARKRDIKNKIGEVITLIADEANWIAYEAARPELSSININIRISSSAYPNVTISFEQFAGWEGKNICLLNKP